MLRFKLLDFLDKHVIMLSGDFMCEPGLLFYGLWKKEFRENLGLILDFLGIPSKSEF